MGSLAAFGMNRQNALLVFARCFCVSFLFVSVFCLCFLSVLFVCSYLSVLICLFFLLLSVFCLFLSLFFLSDFTVCAWAVRSCSDARAAGALRV